MLPDEFTLSLPSNGGALSPLLYAAFWGTCSEQSLAHSLRDSWPSKRADVPPEAIATEISAVGGYQYVQRTEDGVAWVEAANGMCSAEVAASSPERAREVMEMIRQQQPVAELDADIGVMFWNYGQHGPQNRYRELTAPRWDEVKENYLPATGEAIERLIDPDFRPSGGQLFLLSGPPGTGKTHAIRAIARETRDWLVPHYIVDPDNFFGHHADYMMEVLLGGGDGEASEKWRLLILEDAGELLQPDAREQMRQGLSRFLNTVDGMIGQGLKLATLVTTNEEVKELHPAVARPGRCAADVVFKPFEAPAADQWLARRDLPPVGKRMTLADLYAQVHGTQGGREPEPIGFGALDACV